MKASIILTIAAAVAASKVSAACAAQKKTGYPCCNNQNGTIYYTDANGKWSVEHGKWCIMPEDESNAASESDCWATKLGYPCCEKTNKVVYTDASGNWGVEHHKWCGIPKETEVENDEDSNGIIEFITPGNPFDNSEFYINPYYVDEIDQAISKMTDTYLIEKTEKMKQYSTAIWLNSIESANELLESNLENAYAQQKEINKNVLTVFVVYNLPSRDCHALASDGELLPKDSDMERYKTEYIDVIESTLKKHKNQPVALIIEPGSLASLVSFKETTPSCMEAEKYYLDGHSYLIKKFGVLEHVSMYLDIGHAYWLGWDDTREIAAKLYANVINSGSPGIIRGFADNVNNYIPWDDPALTTGPDVEFNPCPDSKRYIQALYKDFTSAGIKSVHFISDTSRNGYKIDFTNRKDWCNKSTVGVGPRPQANPEPDMNYVDAFYWVGAAGKYNNFSSVNVFDGHCGEYDYPEKPTFDQRAFEAAIMNANPPL